MNAEPRITADPQTPWTPEPWLTSPNDQHVQNRNGQIIAIIAPGGSIVESDPNEARANMRRIAACGTALRGLNPEAVAELVEACKVLFEEREALESSPHYRPEPDGEKRIVLDVRRLWFDELMGALANATRQEGAG